MIYLYFAISKRTKTILAMPPNLSERLARADPKAIEEIYLSPLGENVRNYVRIRGGDQSMAEDVLVLAIYKVIELLNNGSYQEINRLNGFIMGVAKNIYKEESKRKRKKRKEISLTDNHHQLLKGSLADEMNRLFLTEYIKQHLKELSERDQQVVCLHYLEGYKLVEIDKMLDLSKNHANVICARALKFLRKKMSNGEK